MSQHHHIAAPPSRHRTITACEAFCKDTDQATFHTSTVPESYHHCKRSCEIAAHGIASPPLSHWMNSRRPSHSTATKPIVSTSRTKYHDKELKPLTLTLPSSILLLLCPFLYVSILFSPSLSFFPVLIYSTSLFFFLIN